MSAPAHPAPAAPIRVPAGTTAGAAVRDAGLPGRGEPDAIVVVRDADGQAARPELDAGRRRRGDPGGRRHRRRAAASSGTRPPTCSPRRSRSCSRQAKLGIGPPITDGFYYDFDVPEAFTPEDLETLEKRMKAIVKDGQLFSRRVYESKDQARAELAGEPYKLELVDDKSGDADIMEVGGDELTAYDNLNPRTRERVWGDLCRGPHIPTTKYIPAFKLTRSSAAYWRGDQANASLQRIYGTAWESQEALDRHLELLEEAQRRDHRKLGVELDLFSFPDELGSGLPVFHPKGGIVRRELEEYSRRKHIEAGYEFVNTPHITKEQLYITSGHLEWYADGMFPPMHIDAEYDEDGALRKPGQDYYLKPMNCPMHHLIFRSRGPLLPRTSVAALRVRHGVPLREVRCHPRPDPGARHDPGRLAHLLHPRADARRTGLAAALRARPARRLRPRRLLSGAVHQGPGEVRRLRRGVGGGHRDAARGRRVLGPASGARSRAARRSTGRRSRCRCATRWAAAGRCRPSSSTSTCPSVSSWSTPPPTAPASGRC